MGFCAATTGSSSRGPWALDKFLADFPSRAYRVAAAKGYSSLCPASARATFTNGFVNANSIPASVSSQHPSIALRAAVAHSGPFSYPVVAAGREPFTFLDPKFPFYLQPLPGFRVRTLAARMLTWSWKGVHVFHSWRSPQCNTLWKSRLPEALASATQCNTFWKFRLPLQAPDAAAHSAAPVPEPQCNKMQHISRFSRSRVAMLHNATKCNAFCDFSGLGR